MKKISIKAERERAGLTQKALALKVGVDQSAVAQWERGGPGPYRGRLPSIAKVLNCTVDDLLKEERE